MTKRILDPIEYTFDASAKTITFTNEILLRHLLLVTNLSSNNIIYNFACDGFGGTLSNNILTLEYDTTSMSTTDLLSVIVYKEDPLEDPIEETNSLLTIIRKQTSLQEAMYEEMVEQTKYLRKIYNPE